MYSFILLYLPTHFFRHIFFYLFEYLTYISKYLVCEHEEDFCKIYLFRIPEDGEFAFRSNLAKMFVNYAKNSHALSEILACFDLKLNIRNNTTKELLHNLISYGHKPINCNHLASFIIRYTI